MGQAVRIGGGRKPAQSTRQLQGSQAEQRALDYLVARGMTPLGTNIASPLGEIDLLMQHGDQWVFVEVRQRKSMAFGGAAASITSAKQLKLRRQAQKILQDRFGNRPWPAMRFDVIAIEGRQEDGKINWLQNAF
jgi:putative endonuclease